MKALIGVVMLVGLSAFLVAGCNCSSCSTGAAKMKMQATCPISGGPINKEYYVDAEGVRIYTCCPKCIDAVKADPKAAIQKLKDKGEMCAPIPMEKM